MTKKQLLVEGFNGERYSAASPKQIVELMRANTFGGEESDGVKGYMAQIAKRVHDWCGASIRTESPAEFLEDLQSAALIRITEKGEQ